MYMSDLFLLTKYRRLESFDFTRGSFVELVSLFVYL